jgi:mRNA interferase RelE/StbE
MTWTVELDPSSERELGKVDPQHAKRILRFLFERLSHLDDPRSIGEALKGSRFDSLWKYRVGEFRIICSIEDNVSQVLVIKVGNRKEVYR